MRLFTRLTFKVTLIFLFINRGNGFMFRSWLRSTTEQNLSTLGQYRYQNHATNEAHGAAGVYRSQPKKDTGTVHLAVIATAGAPPRVSHTPQTDKDVIAAFDNQRTGISPPPRYDKPWNVYDAVVVHSIPSPASVVPSPPAPSFTYVAIPAQNYPLLYYRDESKVQPAQYIASSTTTQTTTTPAPQKSVHVELNYKDDTVVEKIGENVVLHRKIPSQALDPVQPATESAVSSTAATAAANSSSSSSPLVSDSSSKFNVPNLPIKLLGANTAFASQLYYGPAAADIQYLRYPYLRSPIVQPFLYKNTPRAVSERSEIAPPPPPASQITNPKPEKAICENCVLPSAIANYPHALRIVDSNDNAFQKPCRQESSAAAPPNTAISPTFKSSNMAYVLVPSQISTS